MNKHFFIDCNLVIIVILSAIVLGSFYSSLDDGTNNGGKLAYDSGWFYEDGETADPEALRLDEEEITMSKTMTQEAILGGELCFETSNLFFDVYLDDLCIYSFHPNLYRVYGRYYGEYTHTVNIPNAHDGSVLKITYYPLTNTSWTSFRGMTLEEGSVYVRETLSAKFMHFLATFAVFMIGVFLVTLGLALDKRRYRNLETVALGATAIILALWTSSGSRVLQIITENPAMIRLVDHLCLLWLPVPVILFVASVTEMLRSPIVKINLGLVGANTILITTCIMLNLCDYHDLLTATHAILAFGVLSIIYMMVYAIKKGGGVQRSYKYLMVAFVILMVSGVADLVRYYVTDTKDASLMTRIGMYIFIVVLSAYEVSNFVDINKKSLETDIKNELAHKDGLTGLKNRLAFTEAESELESAKGKAAIIQLDINFLKQVNDNYGHAEGDRHIKGAASAITAAFGKAGECYRTGGDEFIVIIRGQDCEEKYKNSISKFIELEKEYNEHENPPVKLCTAYGMAVYEAGVKSLQDAEMTADRLMYECKKNLKNSSK